MSEGIHSFRPAPSSARAPLKMDIQDLLDEVEEVIQDRGSKPKQTSKGSFDDARSSRSPDYLNSRADDSYYNGSYSGTSASSSRTKSVDNIDDLLSMIDGGDESPSAAAVHPRHSDKLTVLHPESARAEEFCVTGGSKKCSTLMLGGESAKRGANTAFLSHNVCANLRCNECDFTVVQFVGKKWSSNADYMFFRENVPNEAKLRARMEVAPGSAAYACQCKWLSIDVQTRVDMCRVKWSCAGH